MSDKPEMLVRGYSLTRKEVTIIERVSNERKLFNDSAALRQILDEWEEMKKLLANSQSAPQSR
jgi:hypothetical protein